MSRSFTPAAALALLAVGLLGFSRSPKRAGAPPVTRLSRVLLIGDSFAVGLKGPLGGLAGAASVPFEGHGITGTRIAAWAKNPLVDQALASFRPTHVLVSLGTNDEKVGTGIAAQEQGALNALLQKLRAGGAEVAWIGPPSLPFSRVGVSDMVRGAVARYFPSETMSIPREKDQLHPTAAGYASWADAIWRWLTGAA